MGSLSPVVWVEQWPLLSTLFASPPGVTASDQVVSARLHWTEARLFLAGWLGDLHWKPHHQACEAVP